MRDSSRNPKSGAIQLRKSIIIIAILMGLLIIPQVQAQDEHQLTWGVTSDLRIRYSVTETSHYTPNDGTPLLLQESYEVVASFSSFPEIRHDLLDSLGLPTTIGLPTFVNGSDAPGAILVLPIGNWTQVQDLDSVSSFHTYYGDVLRNATYFEDESTWGRRYNYTTWRYYEYDEPTVILDCNITVTQIFSKTDGAIVIQQTITDFFSEHSDHDFGTIIETVARIAEVPTVSEEILSILIVGVGSTVVTALIAIYWFRIKKK